MPFFLSLFLIFFFRFFFFVTKAFLIFPTLLIARPFVPQDTPHRAPLMGGAPHPLVAPSSCVVGSSPLPAVVAVRRARWSSPLHASLLGRQSRFVSPPPCPGNPCQLPRPGCIASLGGLHAPASSGRIYAHSRAVVRRVISPVTAAAAAAAAFAARPEFKSGAWVPSVSATRLAAVTAAAAGSSWTHERDAEETGGNGGGGGDDGWRIVSRVLALVAVAMLVAVLVHLALGPGASFASMASKHAAAAAPGSPLASLTASITPIVFLTHGPAITQAAAVVAHGMQVHPSPKTRTLSLCILNPQPELYTLRALDPASCSLQPTPYIPTPYVLHPAP